MRFIHTSDWHIGHRLYGQKRYQEFEQFLDWLITYFTEQTVDALLISGDIFDSTTPGNRALALYYRFLHRIAHTSCRNVIIIAGNHDSPTLLDAPRELLSQINVHVIASPRNQPEEQVFLLQGADDADKMIVCAVPFLRDKDIRSAAAAEDMATKSKKLQEEIRSHYQKVCAAAENIRSQHRTSLPIVAMGHLFTAGGRTVDGDGVRELYIGGLAHLHSSGFPDAIDYLALGHLHIAQRVGGKEQYRYCGSPLPMGFNEAEQQKYIFDVSLLPNDLQVTPVHVPCFQDLVKLEGDLTSLTDSITQLAKQESTAWLELFYSGSSDPGRLRQHLQDAVQDTSLTILRIRTNHSATVHLQQQKPTESLDDLSVEEVFERCLASTDYTPEQCTDLRLTFQKVVASLDQEDIDRG